jgi:hypothetical protein
VYHVELREFPHNTHAYNLDGERLRATLLEPFMRGEIFQFGDREWVPQRTRITILEGEQLPLHALSMGRGWNNARRKGKDVTTEIFEAAGGAPALAANAKARPAKKPPSPAGASPQPDIPDQIRKLGELRDSGLLSDDEFATKKAELLARM